MRSLPVACDSSAFGSSAAFDHHMAEARRLLSLAAERRELSDGWALRLPGDDATVLAAANWILAERRCCPFLTFALECNPERDTWLRITGPEGTKDVLRAELDKLRGFDRSASMIDAETRAIFPARRYRGMRG